MCHETHQKLDDIRQTILKLRDVPDTVFDELHAKISKLLALVEIQKKLSEISRPIREQTTLPVRRINYNIKKLTEDDEECKIRWSKMRMLNCSAIIFSTMAFNGLISLPDKQYECLVENVQDYVEVQELPCQWITRDQIRRVVANTPRCESTKSFLQSYHVLEVQLSQDASSNPKASGRKRQRTEGEFCHYRLRSRRLVSVDAHATSTNQEPHIGEMQTGELKIEQVPTVQTGRRKQEHLVMYKTILKYLLQKSTTGAQRHQLARCDSWGTSYSMQSRLAINGYGNEK
ncbi:hypothetical protein DL98DRAFT_233995 [Cadophora sp. DSE1049]|nr:hypothetical protein DL98DRAFT_233995 [Cadophora sp. DSE1049]